MGRLAAKHTFSANTLIHEGVFYKIGEKRNSVKDSKLADDDYYLLTLAALAKECQSGAIPNGACVVLGVGLPLKHFATVRKSFVRYLKREQQPVQESLAESVVETGDIVGVGAVIEVEVVEAESIEESLFEEMVVEEPVDAAEATGDAKNSLPTYERFKNMLPEEKADVWGFRQMQSFDTEHNLVSLFFYDIDHAADANEIMEEA